MVHAFVFNIPDGMSNSDSALFLLILPPDGQKRAVGRRRGRDAVPMCQRIVSPECVRKGEGREYVRERGRQRARESEDQCTLTASHELGWVLPDSLGGRAHTHAHTHTYTHARNVLAQSQRPACRTCMRPHTHTYTYIYTRTHLPAMHLSGGGDLHAKSLLVKLACRGQI